MMSGDKQSRDIVIGKEFKTKVRSQFHLPSKTTYICGRSKLPFN